MGCHIFFYCSRDCQKNHWNEGHKKQCKLEKKSFQKQKYTKELEAGIPDPNQFNHNGGIRLLKKYNPEKIRFDVGDKVECIIGKRKYGTGKIVKLMYRQSNFSPTQPSALYQIHLDQETGRQESMPPQYVLIYLD